MRVVIGQFVSTNLFSTYFIMVKILLRQLQDESGATVIESIALAAIVMMVLLVIINYLNGPGGELIKINLIDSIQTQIDTWNETGYR